MSIILSAGVLVTNGDQTGDTVSRRNVMSATPIRHEANLNNSNFAYLTDTKGDLVGTVNVENLNHTSNGTFGSVGRQTGSPSSSNHRTHYNYISIDVFNCKTNATVTLRVKPGLLIEHLKVKVEREFGVDVDDQILFLDDQALEDGDGLSDYAIEDGDEIVLKTRRKPRDTFEIEVSNYNTEERLTLNVKPGLFVEHLKDKIERELDIDVEDQILFFGDKVLEDGDRLSDFGIEFQDEIVLKTRRKPRNTFEIEVFNYNTEERLTLHVKPGLFVEHLRDKIERELDIDVEDQILFFGDKVLEDGDRLCDFGIEYQDEVVLKTRPDPREPFCIVLENEDGERFDYTINRRWSVQLLKRHAGQLFDLDPDYIELSHAGLTMSADFDDVGHTVKLEQFHVAIDSTIHVTC